MQFTVAPIILWSNRLRTLLLRDTYKTLSLLLADFALQYRVRTISCENASVIERLPLIFRHSVSRVPFPSRMLAVRGGVALLLRSPVASRPFASKVKVTVSKVKVASSFKCPHCAFADPSKAAVKKHVTAAHAVAAPYACPDCGRGFTNFAVMRRHARDDHGARLKEPYEVVEAVQEDEKVTLMSQLKVHCTELFINS